MCAYTKIIKLHWDSISSPLSNENNKYIFQGWYEKMYLKAFYTFKNTVQFRLLQATETDCGMLFKREIFDWYGKHFYWLMQLTKCLVLFCALDKLVSKWKITLYSVGGKWITIYYWKIDLWRKGGQNCGCHVIRERKWVSETWSLYSSWMK